MHMIPTGQTVMQSPQWSSSLATLTHAPSHAIVVPPHSHVPMSHIDIGGHGALHPPQCCSLLSVSTHALLHTTSVAFAQSEVHCDSAQISVGKHGELHAPQFWGSSVVSTQLEPHSSVPAGHTQSPATHDSVEKQCWLQPPQLSGSVSGSAQSPGHSIWPSGQPVMHVPDSHSCPSAHG
jgi:hypothetical protein